MATRAELISAYLAYFGRPPDFDGLKFYENVPYADVIANFSKSPESVALYGSVFGAAQINAIYQNLFNRDAEPAGLDYWSGRVNTGALSPAAAALGIMLGAQNADKTSVDNKIAIINLFESKLDTAAEIVAYSGAAAAASARAYIKTVNSTAASVTTATTGVDAAVDAAVNVGGAAGLTFNLTTAIDTLVGTSGNDTFIGDATIASSVTAADSINGGDGVDTVKLFGVAAAPVIPTLTNVEKLYMSGAAASVVYNASAVAGLTSIELDGQLGTAATLTVTTGQSVTLSNNTAASFTTTIAGNTPTSLGLTLTNIGNTTGTVDTVDFSGTALATLNITGLTTGSKATLTNTGVALKTINVDGGASVALTSGSAALTTAVTTVNASTATAAVSYDANAASGWSTAAGFKFTGGSGNDSVKLNAGNITALTAGTQLDGGAGTGDKIGTFDTAFTAADYTKLNAATGWEVLGLNAAITVDAGSLTSIKQFSLDTNAAQVINNIATGSKLTIAVTHAANVTTGTSVGVNDLALVIGGATSTGLTVGGNLTLNQTLVALTSNGTGTGTNTITNLVNADNSVYTITGSNALTISTTVATTTASKYDGSAATGKLTINGNTTAYSAGSALGDIIIGGTAGDVLKASINNATLTGNAGADTFDVSVALGGAASITTVTDFTKGDKLTFGATAGAFTTGKVDLSGAATVAAALDLLAAGNNSDLKWGTFGGNTYIVDDVGAGATFGATDTAVKLTGVLDLSTSTLATNTVTFA